MNAIGQDVHRIESQDKVTGKAKYCDDYNYNDTLYAKILTSTYPHANLVKVDVSEAEKVQGVISVVTGDNFNSILCGSLLQDRPPLAVNKVRYYGEPIAMVVAFEERIADIAVNLIQVEYEPLEIIYNPKQAIEKNTTLIHPKLSSYKKAVEDIKPESNTNIANRVKIRKGDMNKGWSESDVVVESSFSLPQSDHIAMETRCAIAEISADGTVNIITSSQAPYEVKGQISKYFDIPEGKIKVNVPLVGGAFGGKSAVTLEILAYIGSLKSGGRKVKITNTREIDMITSPCRMGLEANIKMGVSRDGLFKAAEITYLLDNGAYTDIGPRIAKAMAVDCTGPYFVENIYCDSLAVYTNHPYITAYRGFGHDSFTFCIERVIDKVANRLGIDAVQLRLLNAIKENDYTPTQVKVTKSN